MLDNGDSKIDSGTQFYLYENSQIHAYTKFSLSSAKCLLTSISDFCTFATLGVIWAGAGGTRKGQTSFECEGEVESQKH